MDNWFPIGKHVDCNLVYPPVGTVKWAINQPFSVPALAESPGCRVFLTGTRCRD